MSGERDIKVTEDGYRLLKIIKEVAGLGSEGEALEYVVRRFLEQSEILREILSRLDVIEGEIEVLRGKLDEIRELLEVRERRRVKKEVRKYYEDLVQYIEDRVYVFPSEIKAKKKLQRLIEEGVLVHLRDEGLNVEVITTKKVIERILAKLPLKVTDVDKVLTEREQQLFVLLNRLGYILKKGDIYVRAG